jgi:NAD(P)-dependent dehydrogenase (short-subunit alcohol dehydrogenase family)
MAVNSMNIFITGASGFVGGAAARRLVAQGHHVRAMSRSSSRRRGVWIGSRSMKSCADVSSGKPFLIWSRVIIRKDRKSAPC